VIRILPAILQYNKNDLQREIERMANISPFLHIDIVGELVEGPKTIMTPYELKEVLDDPLLGVQYSVHLMLNSEELKNWVEVVADIATVEEIIIHYEVGLECGACLEQIRSSGKAVGLAINPETELQDVNLKNLKADLVLVMGVTPGAQGRSFNPNTIGRVRAIHEEHPEVEIAVDGGVAKEGGIVKSLVSAGVVTLIVGSKIVKSSDPERAYAEILKEVENC